jgi:hypothetical protein
MVDTANKRLITLQISTPDFLHGVIEKSAFAGNNIIFYIGDLEK